MFHKIMKIIKFKYFGFILGALTVYLILFHSLLDKFGTNSKLKVFVNLQYVVVHIDLKGAPPRLQYLESLIPLLKKYDVNGILMEYEDMFPYEGSIVNLSARNSYDRKGLKSFLEKASAAQVEIIPLIQTFGHMEHVLKLEEFQHMREDPMYPDSICPSNTNSILLLKDMLTQVINFHNKVAPLKHIHIGCDEVYHINRCKKCLLRLKKNTELLVDHLVVLKGIISSINPKTKILMWDDMFRSIKKRWDIKRNKGISDVEPVYWDYTPDLSVSHKNLYNYHKSFNNIWIASAYKGADGRQAILPQLKDRFLNHFSWMNLILEYVFAGERRVYNFKGIILTGWSRYSHMDPLCELFPVSIPSLMLNILLIQRFRQGINISDMVIDPYTFFDKYIQAEFSRSLGCIGLIDVQELVGLFDGCTFESGELYGLLKQYKLLVSDINAAFNNEGMDISILEYNFKYKNINMNNLKRTMDWCNATLKEIGEWKKSTSKEMTKFYDTPVIKEFVGQKMLLAKNKVSSIVLLLNKYKETRVWDRRPYRLDVV